MSNKARNLKILSFILGALLVFSVFKNISYSLLWGDESMTTMGCERVLKYGYPKSYDGKNVLNDMVCSTPKVAINPKDDAFIGGANWGQYYYGVIGYLLAENTNDIYAKTGIYRSTFAIIGLLGVFLLAFAMAKFFEDLFYKYLFISLFLLAELISISLALHLREVRYYSPAFFFSSSIICLYTLYRFYPKESPSERFIRAGLWDKPFNPRPNGKAGRANVSLRDKIFYSIALAALLWIAFNMFSPLYFIFILAIIISEGIIAIFQYIETKKLKEAFIPCLPTLASILISFIFVYPLLGYFKTFEMKKVLDAYYHFSPVVYWWHFSTEFRYFNKFELLWLAVGMRTAVLLNYKKVFPVPKGYIRPPGLAIRTGIKSKLLRVSNFLTLLFVIFLFSIPNVASPIFTRYLIYMQPVLPIIAIFDFIFLLKLYSTPLAKSWNTHLYLLVGAFTALFGFTFVRNLPYIEGHLYEMTHQYKGPLDYTIPYIQSHYQRPDTLIIAANCGESPYVYYLKCKTLVGFVGNNLPQDTLYQPDIIAYRQVVGSFFISVFNGYLRKAKYKIVSFPTTDIPSNNTPELNFDTPIFNHNFKSLTTDDESKEEHLIIKL